MASSSVFATSVLDSQSTMWNTETQTSREDWYPLMEGDSIADRCSLALSCGLLFCNMAPGLERAIAHLLAFSF